MISQVLIKGECAVWKNNHYMATGHPVEMSYDDDLGHFKIISNGKLAYTFNPSQIIGLHNKIGGTLTKKLVMTILVKYPTGDELGFVFKTTNFSAEAKVKQIIDVAQHQSKANQEVATLLKTRERVPLAEVCHVLAQHELPDNLEQGKAWVERIIVAGLVSGVVEGNEFVSSIGLQRESVRYQVVAKFEVSNNGVVKLNCPRCGASLPVSKGTTSGKCTYCGGEYKVPSKILSLL